MNFSAFKKLKKSVALVLAAVLAIGSIPMIADSISANASDAAETTTTVWNFRGGEEGAYAESHQTTVGEFNGMTIDGTNGKIAARLTSGDTQINAGSKLVIPVPASANYVVTVEAYQGTAMAIGETALEATGESGSWPYIAASGTTDASTTSITLDVTASGYIKEVKLEVTPVSGVATTVWNFRGGEEGAYAESHQTTVGEFNGMTIDGTNGKIAARLTNGDTQINAGSKLVIPVPASSDYYLVVEAYQGTAMQVSGVALEATGEKGDWPYIAVKGQTNASQTSITLEVTAGGYIKEVSITTSPTPVPTKKGNGKLDVVDFGCEALDAEKYNNLNSVDLVNSFYGADVAPGSSSVNIGDFTINDAEGNKFLTFCAGGKTNNRYRTTNEAISRWDNKSLSDAAGTVYSGYVYSNNSASADVYMSFELNANDILTLMLGSNGGAAKYAFETPDGQTVYYDFTETGKVSEATFYASVDGTYKLWCTNEKLVVARATREHTQPVNVTGTSTYNDVDKTGTAAPTDYSIAFTNTKTNAVTSAPILADGSYSVYLYEKYDYTVSLLDANGYVINSAASLSLADGAGNTKFDIEVKPVKITYVSGKLTGLAADALAKLQLNFISDEVYVPELTVAEDGSFTLKVEAGITYKVEAVDVNDYELKTVEFKADADMEGAEIVFEAKPTYDATVVLDNIKAEDAVNAIITFTNISEKYTDGTAYTYTYKYGDAMKLRDGQYTVTVRGLGNLAKEQAPTKDIKINGAAGSTTAKFYDVTNWDFAKYNGGNPGIEIIGGNSYYAGLVLSAANVAENKTYLLVNPEKLNEDGTVAAEAGTVKVPVKAGDLVTLSYCYQASFEIDGKVYTTASGSTSTIESVQVVAAADGFMTIKGVAATDAATEKAVAQTYFTSIKVVTPVAYKETITVGKDKEYQTINDALDAVEKMGRPNGERVTIMIDPGNYEEMLVIDMPNVTLKNASATPSTELKNSGVDIDENAVRITSYYGHGYTYYSMGKDCKWNADLLEVNKANGYEAFENPGTGTTSGSYWNATVVVYAGGFNADGIIFENSFNQYVSPKAADDVIVALDGAKGEANGARNDMEVGSTAVQAKAYVERAAALSIANDVPQSYFDNCRFIGRQDTLYIGLGSTMAFNKCAIYGGTDYIFGGATAVFNKCELVFNTSEDNNDVGYITASQSAGGRGMLFNNCTVTSTVPGVDTASAKTSKPGYLGRPWGTVGEAIFANTIIETTDFNGTTESLIVPAGWNNTLSGESPNSCEYNSIEMAGVDNSANRVSWAPVLKEAKLADGSEISVKTFLGDWAPFSEDDLKVEIPAVPSTPTEPETPSEPETEAPTQGETQAPSETETQKPSETETQKPSETETQKPSETETQKPSETETQKPSETETQKPSESETQAPTEAPTQAPTEAPTEPSTEAVEVEGADKDVVKDAVIGDDVKFEGDVKPEDVKLVIEKAVESVIETVKAALETVLEAIDVKVDDVDAKYYDISLKAGDNVVKLKSGKVQITFAWEDGKSADKHDAKVYHYNKDNKLEEVKATVTADGIKIEADDFSPYVVVYSAKADAPDTGDASPVVFYMVLCAAMLAAGVMVSRKKRA